VRKNRKIQLWGISILLAVLLLALLFAFIGGPRQTPSGNSRRATQAGIVPIPTEIIKTGFATSTHFPTTIPTTTATPRPPTAKVTPQPSSTSTASSTPAPTQTPAPQPTPYLKQNFGTSWSLIFDDEFNHADPSKWNTCYWWDNNGCTNSGNKELEWYLPSNVEINKNALVLIADKRGVQGSDGKYYNYTSGMVTTGRIGENTSIPVKFGFKYGFAEIRAIVPVEKGLWPAFWMLPVNNKSRPEIDVMEVIGGSPNTVNVTLHGLQADGAKLDHGSAWSGQSDLSQGYHTYAVDWEPDHIAWYVDGVEIYRYTDAKNIPSEPMYLLLNLAVGGYWPGNPDANTTFPSYFTIDYVRVWQRGNTPTP
jgi:beta-glucanase (GH16 family)